jgi:hypothetical protein
MLVTLIFRVLTIAFNWRHVRGCRPGNRDLIP